MSARDPLWTQNSGPTGILDVSDVRVGHSALWQPGSTAYQARSGFRPWTYAGNFTFATGTPDGFVHVQAFQAVIQSSRLTTGGAYVVTFDGQVDVNILSTPANATNPRDDLIIAQVTDTFHGDGSSAVSIVQVVGTPAASPSDPAVPGSSDYLILARVRVGAAATTISQANITDLRTAGHAKSLTAGFLTAAAGAVLPVDTQAQRDAIASKYTGYTVWRTDAQRLEVYGGSSWLPISPFPLSYEKVGNTSRGSTTTLADDPELVTASLPANSKWEVDLKVFYTANGNAANSGLKVGFSGPAGATFRWMPWLKIDTDGTAQAAAVWVSDTDIATSVNTGGAGVNIMAGNPRGTLTIAGTAGVFAFRWAQCTSNGTATVVKAGSILTLTRLA